MTRHLRNHLTTLRSLREGFIEQHGSEPSVSLKYSEQSTSNSTISLKVVSGSAVPSTSATDNDEGTEEQAQEEVMI